MLVERAVAAAVEAYAAVSRLPSPPPLALELPVYFDGDAPGQLTPPPVAWDPREGSGDEFASPDVTENPALVALLDAINADWDEGNELLEAYFAGLAVALHKALGPFVVVTGTDVTIGAPAREQLLAQMTPAEAAEWEANDWLPRDRRVDALLAELDIVVSERIDHSHVAAVFRREGVLCGMAPVREPRFARELDGALVRLGGDPFVVAGLLPAGAATAAVQDLFDVWHDARVGGGAWLCVLPHEERGGLPPVVFRDAAGAEVKVAAAREPEFDEWAASLRVGGKVDEAAWRAQETLHMRRVVAAAAVPVLWPAGAPRPPRLRGWSGGDVGATALELEHGEWAVSIDEDEFKQARPRDVLEEKLYALGGRAAARVALEAVEIELAGSIAGKPVTFVCASAAGRWAAVHARRSRTLTVAGAGAPPPRLDVERLPVDAVESWLADDEDG